MQAPLLENEMEIESPRKTISDLSNPKLIRLLLYTILLPTTLGLLLALIPLGGSFMIGEEAPSHISPAMYYLFLMVYMAGSYPTIAYPYYIILYKINKRLFWLGGFVTSMVVLGTIYYIDIFILEIKADGLLRIAGTFIIWLIVLIFSLHYSTKMDKAASNSLIIISPPLEQRITTFQISPYYTPYGLLVRMLEEQEEDEELNLRGDHEERKEGSSLIQTNYSYNNDIHFFKNLFSSEHAHNQCEKNLEDPFIGLISWRSMFFRGFLLSCCLYVVYTFCQYLTDMFDHYSSSYGFILYLIFSFIIHSMRGLSKFVARSIDSKSFNLLSMEVLMEMFIFTFYYIFYRNLFSLISSYSEFFQIKACMVVVDLFLYPFRMTKLYYKFHERIVRGDTIIGEMYRFFSYEVVGQDLVLQRLCMDYSLRIALIVGSSISYISTISFLRFGYNKRLFKTYAHYSEQEYDQILIFTLLSLIIELLLFSFVNYVSVIKTGKSLFRPWTIIFTSNPLYLWAYIATVSHVITDIYLAKLDTDKIKF